MSAKKIVVLCIATLLLLIVSLCLHLFLSPVRNAFFDTNFLVNSQPACDSVVIVGIDAKSIGSVGGFPWPRSTMAALVQKINNASPRVIALDFEFPMREGAVDNDSLSTVFSRVSQLILPFRIQFAFDGLDTSSMPIPALAYNQRFLLVHNAGPIDNDLLFFSNRLDMSDSIFARYAERGGFLNVTTSRIGQGLRQVIHVMRVQNEYYPSFGLSAAASYLRVQPSQFAFDGSFGVNLGDTKLPLDRASGTALLNFRGRTGAISTISAIDVLQGNVGPNALVDKLVFVGVIDPSANPDFFITPVGSRFPGVEVWATAASDIIQKKWLKPANGIYAVISWLIVFIMFPGLLFVFPASKRRITILVTTGLLGISIVATFLLFSRAQILWDPEFHCYAWLFAMIWLGLSKVDPLRIEILPLELEPADAAIHDALRPPAEHEFLHAPVDTTTMEYVVNKLGVPSTILKSPQENQRNMAVNGASIDNHTASQLFTMNGSRIIRLLGSGGMADVYLVWHPRMEVYRALKVIKPGNSQEWLERFETEIKIFASLNHPNIVQCFTAGYWFDLSCIEMEFVPGMAMNDVLKKCQVIPAQQVMAVGVLVCRALHYAHRQVVTIHGQSYQGVIHRDLKPANIMLSHSGRIKLADFGIARPVSIDVDSGGSDKIVGTLPYISPEQFDKKPATARADIYALGATLYELAAGERAYPQTTVKDLLAAIKDSAFEQLHLKASVPLEFAEIVHRAMAKDPKDRFPSALHMELALEKAMRRQTGSVANAPLGILAKRVWG